MCDIIFTKIKASFCIAEYPEDRNAPIVLRLNPLLQWNPCRLSYEAFSYDAINARILFIHKYPFVKCSFVEQSELEQHVVGELAQRSKWQHRIRTQFF